MDTGRQPQQVRLRRWDGLCPRCPQLSAAPKADGLPYCRPCYNADRRDRKAGKRIPLSTAEPVNEHGLTALQMRILELMCHGLSSKQIGCRLDRSERAIKEHRSKMLEATGCLTSPHLCWWAAKKGLV